MNKAMSSGLFARIVSATGLKVSPMLMAFVQIVDPRGPEIHIGSPIHSATPCSFKKSPGTQVKVALEPLTTLHPCSNSCIVS